jgi:DNA-binding PadR family transcriptional regulator
MHTAYVSVRDGLLSLLGEGPRYGFQLKTTFEETTGGVWSLNVGQVYTTLDRLERDGFVAHDAHDGQKIYRLTEAGRDELGAWWDATPGDEPPPRDELLLKILLALPHGHGHALAVLSDQRAALSDLLGRRPRPGGRSSRPAAISGLAADLVADAVLMRAEADLRWLDRCEARILATDPAQLALPPAGNDDRAGAGEADHLTGTSGRANRRATFGVRAPRTKARAT